MVTMLTSMTTSQAFIVVCCVCHVTHSSFFIVNSIALMRVFPKAIVLTTKSHFHVKRTYASIGGLVVRTITSGKTRTSAIDIIIKQ